ncbi:hypothetical protein DL96DRAFT_1577017 [Flagelloscypha sp. PMI_526]|nr:hypothetical protein DL96DRAFT_1577017 [Flagelloscypha sp. PMI_526]
MLGTEAKSLVKKFIDDPKAMWEALPVFFAPQKAGARFHAYRTLTSMHLREDEDLLSLTSRVSDAMRRLKESRSPTFSLEDADNELHAVVLLMALPVELKGDSYSTLTAPFEQTDGTLDPSKVEAAFTNYQSFRMSSDADSSPALAMSTTANFKASSSKSSGSKPSSSGSSSSRPTCAGCGNLGHSLFSCYQFLDLLGKPHPPSKHAKKKASWGAGGSDAGAVSNQLTLSGIQTQVPLHT